MGPWLRIWAYRITRSDGSAHEEMHFTSVEKSFLSNRLFKLLSVCMMKTTIRCFIARNPSLRGYNEDH